MAARLSLTFWLANWPFQSSLMRSLIVGLEDVRRRLWEGAAGSVSVDRCQYNLAEIMLSSHTTQLTWIKDISLKDVVRSVVQLTRAAKLNGADSLNGPCSA